MAHPQYNGSDIPIFTVPPNWGDGVRLRLLYETKICEALDTSEERHGRRPRCLYGIQFSTFELTGQETGYIRRILELAQAMPMGMPVWTEQTMLRSAVTIGATALQVDNTTITLFPSLPDYALVIGCDESGRPIFNRWEVLAVEEITEDEITLADPVTVAWAAGTMIVPLIFGKLPRATKRQLTDAHGVFDVDFEERFNGGIADQSLVETGEPLEVTYPSVCRDSFECSIAVPEGEIYTLQISLNSGGPWADHVFMSSAVAVDGVVTAELNNDYGGNHYFRIVDQDGVVRAGAVRPLASVIPAPVVEISNVEASAHDMWNDGGFVYPYSSLENGYIAHDRTYLVPRGRYEYAENGTSWDGTEFHIVSVEGEPGATHKWTRDATDPTEDTVMFAYEGVANNAGVYRDDFRYIIKCRSFKDGCRSPITTILVDKRLNQTQFQTLTGKSQTVSGICEEPRTDMIRTDWSRDVSGNFITGLEAVTFQPNISCTDIGGLGPALIALARGTVVSGTHPREQHVFSRSLSVTSGSTLADFGTGDAGQHRTGFDWNKGASSVFAVEDDWVWYRGARFNQMPMCFSGILLNLINSGVHYMGGGATITGPDGSTEDMALMALVQSVNVAEALFLGATITTIPFEVYLVLSAHNDFQFFTVPEYVPPVPTPHETPYQPDTTIYGDDFESYAVDETVFNEGTGFSEAWAFHSYVSPRGEDTFESYSEGIATEMDLNEGSGWSEPWTVLESHFVVRGDDFEEYDEQPLTPLVDLDAGTGWTEGEPWTVANYSNTRAGSDSFEGYSAGVVAEFEGDMEILAAGEGWSDFWVITTYQA